MKILICIIAIFRFVFKCFSSNKPTPINYLNIAKFTTVSDLNQMKAIGVFQKLFFIYSKILKNSDLINHPKFSILYLKSSCQTKFIISSRNEFLLEDSLNFPFQINLQISSFVTS